MRSYDGLASRAGKTTFASGWKPGGNPGSVQVSGTAFVRAYVTRARKSPARSPSGIHALVNEPSPSTVGKRSSARAGHSGSADICERQKSTPPSAT